MKYFLLNQKQENNELIVFFNGWAMNETPVKHLNCEGYDILVFYDYRDLNFDFSQFDFKKYKKKYLVCWSMGVYAANLFADEFKSFDKKIAINGTTKIINDDYGIPTKIYRITIKLFNQKSCEKFIENMFDDGKINPDVTIARGVDELKDELIAIQNIKLQNELDFDKAIISTKDTIVPSENQIAYWEKTQAKVEKIDTAHYPFENYQNWQDLLC